jgi:hypothetical protein
MYTLECIKLTIGFIGKINYDSTQKIYKSGCPHRPLIGASIRTNFSVNILIVSRVNDI